MMTPETKDQLSSLVGFTFSVVFCFASIRQSLGTLHQPDSGLFPLFGGVCLGSLCLINFISATRKKRSSTSRKWEPLKSDTTWKNIFITLGVLFAFPLLLNLIGFAPAIFLFFLILLRFIEPQRWSISLGGSAAGAIILYLIFQHWLKIRFPTGLLGL